MASFRFPCALAVGTFSLFDKNQLYKIILYLKKLMFESTIALLKEYRIKKIRSSEGVSDSITELEKRVFQIKYLFDQAKFYNDRVLKIIDTGQDIDSLANEFSLAEIYSESFYHFAWRIIEISKKSTEINEIARIGIHEVRNRLIQHPEQDITRKQDKSKITTFFTANEEVGPKIKSYKGPSNSFSDAGLFVNAKEMEIKLNEAIQKLIHKSP